MAQVNYCDVCGNVIKDGCIKWAIAIQPVKQISNKELLKMNIQEQMEEMQQRYDNTILQEMCDSCKKIHDHLFELRKEEIERMKKELEESYNKNNNEDKMEK
jgi:hypothetical protein